MTTMSGAKDKCITVIDKHGEQLKPCTPKRAYKLVFRNCARWIGYNKIQLIVNPEDKKQMRKEIIAESKNVCYICSDVIPEGQPPTIDHVFPKSRGGEDTKDNQKCCCKRCNDAKGNLALDEFIEYIHSNRKLFEWIQDDRLIILAEIAATYI